VTEERTIRFESSHPIAADPDVAAEVVRELVAYAAQDPRGVLMTGIKVTARSIEVSVHLSPQIKAGTLEESVYLGVLGKRLEEAIHTGAQRAKLTIGSIGNVRVT